MTPKKLRSDTPGAKLNLVISRVNLILFDLDETSRPLPRTDRRAVHLLDVLRRQVGDTFDVGLVHGTRGKATLAAVHGDRLELTFDWGPALPARDALVLIIGLPRPQTARDVLRDATTLGATALHFVRTEKGDPNYAQSSLWHSGEWRRHILAGAEQAFDPRIPDVAHGASLDATVTSGGVTGIRVALDNYESAIPFGAIPFASGAVTIAIGAERGWSAAERDRLRAHGFQFAHLGTRVLRSETAVVAALAIVRAKLGLM